MTLPRERHKVWPVYPLSALAQRIEGSVTVAASVNAKGRVEEAKALYSSRIDKRVLSDFERAATESVRKTSFYPAKVNGTPTKTWMTVTVDFKIK